MDKNTKSTIIKLRILFWNTRSFRQRSKEIPRILKDLDIFICVESWLLPEHDIHFPGFLTFRKDRTHARGGGILLLIRKNLAYVELTDINSPVRNIEICGININNIHPKLNLIVIYRAPDLTLSLETWELLFQNFKQPNTIVMGDFNSHNIIWNCNRTDKNGERLESCISNCNLFLHNNDSITYVDVHKNITSNLDLIMSRSNIADKIDVHACDETWGSDHVPIFIYYTMTNSYYEKK